MGWNPDSPTNPMRVTLVAYLRDRLRAPIGNTEAASLRGWIAWLDGATVSDEDMARATASRSDH